MKMRQTFLAAAVAVAAAASGARADTVLDWNGILIETVKTQNPFFQARFAAITQVAVFEAVNAVTGHYEPYLGTISPAPGASAEAAAVAAAHGVLAHYFPAQAAALDQARAASLAPIPDGTAKDLGVATGEAAAAAMVALRATDGSGSPVPYVPLPGPGYWQPTPPAFAAAALPHWGKVAPFGIESGQQFRSEAPPSLGNWRYTRDYREVQKVGGADDTHRPADRAAVARYFAAISAPQAWNQAAVQVSAARRRSLSANARTLALLNMAISDGLVSSFETKYFYSFWRPVTAIRAGDTDGNPHTSPDTAFLPFIATPAFPSYPSAHASASYAAREVLERLFGRGCHAIILSNPAVPGVTLYYTDFAGITRDVDDARVYGGIHFRFDQEAGAAQGRRVGGYVHRHNLRFRHPGHHGADSGSEGGGE
jgi:hypothetical protein